MQKDKYIVPGLYAEIKDYQLISLETPQSLTENAIVLLGDLPDFVYVPDETSSNVEAVKKVRIVPNTILPITNTEEAIRTLSGENILSGILTQTQKEELICKDMLSAIKLAAESATVGELAIVKIVKRDGTRPDVNNKFEVFQALENTYEKLGNVKCSQIVPIGIAGDEDFITGEEKEPILTITQSEEDGAVIQDKIFNEIYSFSPTKKYENLKVEFALEHPEYLNYMEVTTESKLIKDKGLDSIEVEHLLKGKVLVEGKEVLNNIQLKFDKDKFVAKNPISIPVVEGEINLSAEVGTVFATVKTADFGGKTVAQLETGSNKPVLNYFEVQKVIAEVDQVDVSPKQIKSGGTVTISGTLKEAAKAFTAKISGDGVVVTKEVTLNPDGIHFEATVTVTGEEGAKQIEFKVENPYTPLTKQLDVTISNLAMASETETETRGRRAKAKAEFRSIAIGFGIGVNQYVMIDVIKPSSNWISISNSSNLKEEVTKLGVLEGKKNGVETYIPESSGTYNVTFEEREKKYFVIVEDPSEEKETIEQEITVKDEDGAKVIDTLQYITLTDMTLVLYEGLIVIPKPVTLADRSSIYFDSKVDEINEAKYVINFVPKDSEIIKNSLQYIQQQITSLSETLIVWGVKPPVDAESNTVNKYINNLINLPKFKKGFKVRTSASKEVDLGAFVSVVVGPIKINGIGGITNFTSHKVLDFERTNGGSGEVKPLTNKLFVELTNEFVQGTNVELKTYVGVKQKVMEAVVLSTKEVMGKTMVTLNKEIDTSVFSLEGFEVMLANTDAKDRHGSFAALAFAIKANKERDRAPLQQDLNGVADINFSRKALETLLKNKFTVISKNLISGKGVIVDTPTMTRPDSDFQNRSSIGTLLVLLNKLRKVADTKKGKRFPKKEDKVMLEQDLKNVFVDELQRGDALITAYKFRADMRYLDNYGYLSAEFEIQDAKKLEKVKFSGGLARLNA